MKTEVKCSGCGRVSITEVPQVINVGDNPELKEKVISGELFIYECPSCGHRELLEYNLLYHDPDAGLLVCVSDRDMSVEGMQGYTGRLVSDAGSLIEKIKIFDAGLDDVVMELCKYVTAQELGKDVSLRFLNMTGADHEITLAYPDKGQMQMVQIGFNVYEDCAGIVNRNPVLKEAAAGFIRIDQEWLYKFMK